MDPMLNPQSEPNKTEPAVAPSPPVPTIDNSLTPDQPETSVAAEPSTPVEPAAPTQFNQVVTPTPAPADQPVAPTVHDAPELPKHGGTPIAAVIIAIIIAVALAGLTVFAYLKSRNTTPQATTTTQSPTTASTTKATTTDVDKATSDTDKALSSLDDTNEFATTGLSDSTLGL